MKKMIVMLIAGAVAVAASADITSWSWAGGVISPTLASGSYADAALTLDYDPTLVPSYTGTTISVYELIGSVIATHDLAVAPLFFGGTYSTSAVASDGSAAGSAWLVIDPNGGGLQVGDIIGLGGSGVINDLRPGGLGTPQAPQQTLAGGYVEVLVEDIPEPSTIALMGIAGFFVVLARKKKFR